MVTSGEAGIDGIAPSGGRAAARGGAGRVGRDRRGRRRSTSSACPTASSSTACALRRAIGAVGPPAPTGDRHHQQLPRHLGRRATSTRPTTSRPGGPRSTPCATPGTAGSSPSRSRTVWSRGAASARSGPPPPRLSEHGVDITETFDRRRASRWRRTRPTSTGLGWENFDPEEFLEGWRAGTPAPGSACRWRPPSRCSRWAGARSAPAARRSTRGQPSALTLTDRRTGVLRLDALSAAWCNVGFVRTRVL